MVDLTAHIKLVDFDLSYLVLFMFFCTYGGNKLSTSASTICSSGDVIPVISYFLLLCIYCPPPCALCSSRLPSMVGINFDQIKIIILRNTFITFIYCVDIFSQFFIMRTINAELLQLLRLSRLYLDDLLSVNNKC